MTLTTIIRTSSCGCKILFSTSLRNSKVDEDGNPTLVEGITPIFFCQEPNDVHCFLKLYHAPMWFVRKIRKCSNYASILPHILTGPSDLNIYGDSASDMVGRRTANTYYGTLSASPTDRYGCRLGAGLFFKFRMPDAPR